MAELTLISEWGQTLDKEKGATLEKGNGNAYYSFDGVTLTNENLGEDDKDVKIGIYQVDDNVYAFASTQSAASESGVKIKVGDGEPQNATLIAFGKGTLDEGTKTVKEIQITLKGAEENAQFKQLGFSGDNITKILDSDKADTIYVIGGASKGLPNATLEFAKGVASEGEDEGEEKDKEKDKVIFVGSSTIQSINSGGGGYTHLSVRGSPRSGRAEGFQCNSYELRFG